MKNYVRFEDAKELLREADVLLFRSRSLGAFFIRRASEGEYSHVAVASAHGDNGGTIWEAVEFKEWKGGRTVNLKEYIKSYKGEIDVYRASIEKIVITYDKNNRMTGINRVPLNSKLITNTMRRMTGLPYGWKRVLWLAQHKLPFLRFFYSMESVVDDNTKDLIYPVCSTAVAYSFSKAGYDLVHHRADISTEPSDIARSPLLNYLFTLKS